MPVAAEDEKTQAWPVDQRGWIDVWNCRPLLDYFQELNGWHGYIQFLGLGLQNEYQDVRAERLFVEPNLSELRLSADDDEAHWTRLEPVWQTLGRINTWFILGDPGAGKSTLVSWITSQLIAYGENPYRKRLGQGVPLPFVLRDLDLSAVSGWDSLLDALLRHPKARPLAGEKALIDQVFKHGQGVALFDGFDEVGGTDLRERLAAAIQEGVLTYPGSRFVVTSRIVGFEPRALFPKLFRPSREADADGRMVLDLTKDTAAITYVAPFTLAQIEQFCRAWYQTMESAAQQAEAKFQALRDAVRNEPRLTSLARIPNLLTMMALVHRNNGYLPHGRIELYDAIADAYLESIDRFRKFERGNITYTLEQQKTWLARIAREAQELRAAGDAQATGTDGTRPILQPMERLLQQVTQALAEAGAPGDHGAAAAAWLDHVARRSGLLIPRGEGLYAFAHLSFQEYFAACALRLELDTLAAALFAKPAEAAKLRRAFTKRLQGYAANPAWREALVLLFESLSNGGGEWTEQLLALIYPEIAKAAPIKGETESPRVLLLADIVMDSVVALPRSRVTVLRALWRLEGRKESRQLCLFDPPVLRYRLLGRSAWAELSWQILLEEAQGETWLNLGNTPISDLSSLAGLTALHVLRLDNTSVSDLTPLAGLKALEKISLVGTAVSDLTPLAGLTSLQVLRLDNTPVSDLTPLAGLMSLEELSLVGTAVSELTPLAGLTVLQELFLGSTRVSDLSPLAGFTALETLGLNRTQVSDLTPLGGLKALKMLSLKDTAVSDLKPLAGLTALQELFLGSTQISDLSPLAGLPHLQVIGVSDSVRDTLTPAKPRRRESPPRRS